MYTRISVSLVVTGVLAISMPALADNSRSLKLKGIEPEIPEYIEPYESDALSDPGSQQQVLPDASRWQSEQGYYAQGVVYAEKIILEGNTLLPEDVVNRYISRFLRRELTSEDLLILRTDLSREYLQRGYVNSGVILPDQEVVDRTIRLQAIEGSLSDVRISGSDALDEEYYTDRIALYVKKPLNIADVQAGIARLQQHELVERINAKLLPGDALGKAVLDVQVQERTPYQVGLVYDNHHAPSTGAERASVQAYHRSLTGHGDTLRAELGATEGFQDKSLSYVFPVTSTDAALSFQYMTASSIVVEEPFDQIDIESESESQSVGYVHPFLRRDGVEWQASFSIERKHSKSTVLGIPFSFSLGAVDGETTVSMASLGIGRISRSSDEVVAANLQYRHGLDAFDSTIHSSDIPDSAFSTLNGQLQWARRLGGSSKQAIFKAGFQLSQDPLLPEVKYTLGGAATVRGYRENQLVRDSGYMASIELHLPLFTNAKGQPGFGLVLVPFVDYGEAWNVKTSFTSEDKSTLLSVGLGVLWEPFAGFHAQVFWGDRQEDVANPGTDLQDDGIHFLVSYMFL